MQNIEAIGVETLKELIGYLNGEIKIEKKDIELEKIFTKKTEYEMDFKNVKGQKTVKRALEVAAAGRTQYFTYSDLPALGKTMMAKCLPSILPDLRLEEALEVTKIHSIVGLIKKNTPIVTNRVFRAPHHTISGASLIRWRQNT